MDDVRWKMSDTSQSSGVSSLITPDTSHQALSQEGLDGAVAAAGGLGEGL